MTYLDEVHRFSTSRTAGLAAQDSIGHSPFSFRSFDFELGRRKICDLLRANGRVIFTSGEKENISLVLTLACAYKHPTHVVTLATDPLYILEQKQSIEITGGAFRILPVEASGSIDLDFLGESLYSSVTLLCTSLVNRELGITNDVVAIANLAKQKAPALVYVDISHALRCMRLDYIDPSIDIVGFTSGAVYGLPGTGAVWIRDGIGVEWDETENPVGIAGLLSGLVERKEKLSEDIEYYQMLNKLFCERLPYPVTSTLPHILCMDVGVPPSALAQMLLKEEIRVSVGETDPSHVFRAVGRPEALSISFGRYTKAEEAKEAAEKIQLCIQALQKLKV